MGEGSSSPGVSRWLMNPAVPKLGSCKQRRNGRSLDGIPSQLAGFSLFLSLPKIPLAIPRYKYLQVDGIAVVASNPAGSPLFLLFH